MIEWKAPKSILSIHDNLNIKYVYVLMWNGAPKTKFSLPEKKQWSRSLVELGAALDACGTLVMMWVQLSI